MSVVVSLLALTAVSAPDLPGFVLILTGGVAYVLTRRRPRTWNLRILTGLVALSAVLVALHLLWHRLGVAHDWMDPIYAGVVLGYCIAAIGLGGRSTGRRAPSASPGPPNEDASA